MRAALVLVLASGCATTFTDHFFEVTPVRTVPALAGKTNASMHGASCKSVCSSKRDYDGIDYCVIATIEMDPRFVCTVSHKRSAPARFELTYLVDIPRSVDIEMLPETGPIPIELCQAAGCEKQFDSDSTTDFITACAIYPFRPNQTEPHLVCAFNHERAATTM